jgi:hypothetical protein
MASYTSVQERAASLDLVKKKTLSVASKISDSWSFIARSSDQTGLQELHLLLAGQDGMLRDLLDEERAIAEDSTIFIKSVSLHYYLLNTSLTSGFRISKRESARHYLTRSKSGIVKRTNPNSTRGNLKGPSHRKASSKKPLDS